MKQQALLKARREAHAVVDQTGNAYAYQFVKVRRGLVEVRALRGGKTTYTRVDSSGHPTGRPYSLPTPNRATAASVAVAVAAVAGLVADLVL